VAALVEPPSLKTKPPKHEYDLHTTYWKPKKIARTRTNIKSSTTSQGPTSGDVCLHQPVAFRRECSLAHLAGRRPLDES
jgi:hypothetical protein